MESTQIKGIDSTDRETTATLKAGAELVVREKIFTHGKQFARTNFIVDLNGEGAGVDLVSRSVAADDSRQTFGSRINGNTACRGHSECDAIIMDRACVTAVPELTANCIDAELIHEAAIGKIGGRADHQAHDPRPHRTGSRRADHQRLFELTTSPVPSLREGGAARPQGRARGGRSYPYYRRLPRGSQKKTKYFFGVGLGVSRRLSCFQGSRKSRVASFVGRGAAGHKGFAATSAQVQNACIFLPPNADETLFFAASWRCRSIS